MRIFAKRLFHLLRNINKNVYIARRANISKRTSFEGNNKIGENTEIDGIVGFGTYIGKNSTINAKIGKFCSISSDVKMLQGLHPTTNFISTHPAFYSIRNASRFTYVEENSFLDKKYIEGNYSILVGNDVWIGSNVVILPGIRIGDGSIIGAGSVVTKDIEPYSIVVGNPARRIKFRFDDNSIKLLKNFPWWNQPEDWLISNSSYFSSIDKYNDLLIREGFDNGTFRF